MRRHGSRAGKKPPLPACEIFPPNVELDDDVTPSGAKATTCPPASPVTEVRDRKEMADTETIPYEEFDVEQSMAQFATATSALDLTDPTHCELYERIATEYLAVMATQMQRVQMELQKISPDLLNEFAPNVFQPRNDVFRNPDCTKVVQRLIAPQCTDDISCNSEILPPPTMSPQDCDFATAVPQSVPVVLQPSAATQPALPVVRMDEDASHAVIVNTTRQTDDPTNTSKCAASDDHVDHLHVVHNNDPPSGNHSPFAKATDTKHQTTFAPKLGSCQYWVQFAPRVQHELHKKKADFVIHGTAGEMYEVPQYDYEQYEFEYYDHVQCAIVQHDVMQPKARTSSRFTGMKYLYSATDDPLQRMRLTMQDRSFTHCNTPDELMLITTLTFNEFSRYCLTSDSRTTGRLISVNDVLSPTTADYSTSVKLCGEPPPTVYAPSITDV